MFWSVIIESKNGLGEETTFEFKYIPDISKRTQMEDAVATGERQPGIERRNLQAFIIGCGLFGFLGFLGWRTVSALVNGCRHVFQH